MSLHTARRLDAAAAQQGGQQVDMLNDVCDPGTAADSISPLYEPFEYNFCRLPANVRVDFK